MIIDGVHDEQALIALGAWRIGEVRDDDGVLIGHEVEPDLNMAGYDDALAQVEADRLAASWAELRAERNRRLTASDWTQMPDAPLTEPQRTAWAAYRQALRELPAFTAAPATPSWPQEPAA